MVGANLLSVAQPRPRWHLARAERGDEKTASAVSKAVIVETIVCKVKKVFNGVRMKRRVVKEGAVVVWSERRGRKKRMCVVLVVKRNCTSSFFFVSNQSLPRYVTRI